MLSQIQCVASRPWAISADLAAHVHGMLRKEGISALRHLAAVKRMVHSPQIENSRSNPRRETGIVAVVQAVGTLTPQVHVIYSEVTRSTADIAHEMTTFAAEPDVDAIVLELDTLGGEVIGASEAFAAIRAAARHKPVIASANSVAASAGYYLGAAADEFFVDPSGQVGSIGVFALHVDLSRWQESEKDWAFISAGEAASAARFTRASERGVRGARSAPLLKRSIQASRAERLNDESRASLQLEVDRYYDLFVRDVARGREVPVDHVLTGFGAGRLVAADAALAEGMVDRIGTLDEAIARAAELGRARRESSGSRRGMDTPASP